MPNNRNVFLFLLILLTHLSSRAQPPAGGPPPEAFHACSGKSVYNECRFAVPHGEVFGRCRRMRGPGLVCVPDEVTAPISGHSGLSAPASFPRGRPAVIAGTNAAATNVASRIPDTSQGSCFDDRSIISCPSENSPFFGQDAQYLGARPAYRDNDDGTVSDLVTGLMWQQAHNPQRIGWPEAKA